MANHRSMWSGAIRLGMLHVPVTIAKGWDTPRESSFITICADHDAPIDRTERCGAGHADCSLSKHKGVKLPDGTVVALTAAEVGRIEESTKSATLDVQDVQSVYDLPMTYALGSYYVRADKKSKGSEAVFALLYEALADSETGLVVEWGSSASEKLAVIHADVERGIILLTVIPYATEIRELGEQEKAHFDTKVDPAHRAALIELLDASRSKGGFDHTAYTNDAVRLRSEAVDRVMEGQPDPEPTAEPVNAPAPDIMAMIKGSLTVTTGDKQAA